MRFLDRYKMLCAKKGITPTEASIEMGFSSSMPTAWARGATPKTTTIKRVADYFGVDPSFFYEEEEQQEQKKEEVIDQALPVTPLVMMPIVGIVRAGLGTTAEEVYSGEFLSVPVDALHNCPQEHRVLKVVGDSMYPFFLAGDLVIVHLQPMAENGEVVVAIVGDGNGTVKKLHITETGAELVSLNPLYPPIPLTPNDRIYGKVIRVERVL